MGFIMLLLNSITVAGNKCVMKSYVRRTEKLHSSLSIFLIIKKPLTANKTNDTNCNTFTVVL